MTDKAPARDSISEGWQDAFRLRDNLLQPEVYAFEKAYQRQGSNAFSLFGGGTVKASHMVIAAIEAGWIDTPLAEVGEFTPSSNGSGPAKKEQRYYIGGLGIHEMPAGMVLYYGGAVSDAYKEATRIPPN